MAVFTKVVLIVLIVLSLVACAPVPLKYPYIHPTASQGQINTYGSVCFSGDVPSRSISFKAPHEVDIQVLSHAINGSKGNFDLSGGVGFVIMLNIPEGVIVEFPSNSFMLQDHLENTFEHKQESYWTACYADRGFNAGRLNHYGSSYRPPISCREGERIAFDEKMTGAYKPEKWGYRKVNLKKQFLIIFYLPSLKANKYTLTIPPILINGEKYNIPQVKFRATTGLFMQPFNC